MPRGRPPAPTILNNRKGDPSHRRRNTTEPVPPKAAPEMPSHVTDDLIARQEWLSVCQHLDVLGLLSKTDESAIGMYAKTYALYRRAEDKLDEFGDVLLSPNKKFPQVSPYYTARNKYMEDCRRWLIEFGLTPSARARMRVKQTHCSGEGSQCK